jgi:hypothetical protein
MREQIYTCGICGKRYGTVAERNQCERDCIANAEKAAEAKRKAELEAEKTSKQKEIQELIDKAEDLSTKYFEKYGEVPTISYSVSAVFKKKKDDEKDYKASLEEIDNILNFLFH